MLKRCVSRLKGKVEEEVLSKLEKIVDPSTGISIVKLGLIASVKELSKGVIEIVFIPETPYSPLAYSYAMAIKRVASSVEGVDKVIVVCKNHVMAERINLEVNAV